MRICRVDRNRFKVESLPLTDDLDDGADIVARFMQRWEAGEIDLRSIYPSIDDETFAEIPSISVQLRFARKAR